MEATHLAKIVVADRRRNDEEEGRKAGQDSQGFGKVLWLFHLRNEGREEDLRDPKKGDVQDGSHG